MQAGGESFARELLEHLFDAGERNLAGVRTRNAVLTSSKLSPYQSTTSYHEKEAFENVILAAEANGAVTVEWDPSYLRYDSGRDGFIKRISLRDIDSLAHFLGKSLTIKRVEAASLRLSPLFEDHPVLHDVIARWAQIKTVRGSRPEHVEDWIDAARVLEFVRSTKADGGTMSLPIREASARLFRDSKRIESLAAAVDVLLSGNLDTQVRSPDEVWKEIGLFREELPVRMAGNVIVRRSRVTALLDTPYSAMAAETILGLETTPKMVMSIENQTTFHSEARMHCDQDALLLYSNGMPSPAWRLMYKRLLLGLPKDIPVYHWGDVDEGGFRIAWILSRDAAEAGMTLRPWRMHPNEVPKDLQRSAKDGTVDRMHKYAVNAGWLEIAEAVIHARITIEQEAFN